MTTATGSMLRSLHWGISAGILFITMTEEELKADSFSEVTSVPKNYTGTLQEGDSDIVVLGTITLLSMPHELRVPSAAHS